MLNDDFANINDDGNISKKTEEPHKDLAERISRISSLTDFLKLTRNGDLSQQELLKSVANIESQVATDTNIRCHLESVRLKVLEGHKNIAPIAEQPEANKLNDKNNNANIDNLNNNNSNIEAHPALKLDGMPVDNIAIDWQSEDLNNNNNSNNNLKNKNDFKLNLTFSYNRDLKNKLELNFIITSKPETPRNDYRVTTPKLTMT